MTNAERHEGRYQRRKAEREAKKRERLEQFGTFQNVFTFEHLYKSYLACVRGVGWKASTQRFRASALVNVMKLHKQLLNGTFKSRGFTEFDILERGKPRHIRSVHISERVVQRCLCDYCLVPLLSRTFIYDNGASLKGKGYDFAVARVTEFLRKHYREHGNNGYVLCFDFSKYFDNAMHEPIFEELERTGMDDRLLALSKYFITCFGDVGLGLGSQISQIAALALPNKLDHYIKETLGMKYYERYMDDGVIIAETKEELRECLKAIQQICDELGIKLNQKKTQIIKLSQGFTFLKVRYRYGKNGKIIRRPQYANICRMRKKLQVFRRWVDSGRMTFENVRTSYVSWSGHMKRMYSHAMTKSVRELYHDLFRKELYELHCTQKI